MNQLKTFFSVSFFVSILCSGAITPAQDMDAMLQKYKGNQAVITNLKRQLVIKNENGKLAAKSYVTTERLLIGPLSPGIYNKEYIFDSYFDQLEDYDASALNPGRKGYVRSKAASSTTTHYAETNVLYDDARQTEIAFSGLAQGSLLQSEYTLSHSDIHFLPTAYLQENLPVAATEFEVTAPKYVNMKFVVRGLHADQVKQQVTENKNTTTYSFTASDIPAEENYDNVPSGEWYVLQIIPYVLSYKLPGEDREDTEGTPAHLYRYMYQFARDVNTHPDDTIMHVAALITQGDKTQLEKAAHIYQWVQHNIHYIAFEDSLEGFIPRQAPSIYQRKFGDCKDMASILVALCRAAGIKAYYTWIGTNSKPYTYEEVPLPKSTNHMICTVQIDGNWIFMDGTHPLIPFGIPPAALQGKEALVGINENEYKIITVPETDASFSVVDDTTLLTITDKEISGKTSLHLKGRPAWGMELELQYTKNETRDKYIKSVLERGSNKYVQQSYEYLYADTGSKPCTLLNNFTLNDYVQKAGKECYINLNLKPYFADIYVDSGRKIPEYFEYKNIDREIVILSVPKGYHVSYLPPDSKDKLDGVWEYSLTYTQEGDKIVMARESKVYATSLQPENFAQHNKIIERLRKQYKETVVLTAN